MTSPDGDSDEAAIERAVWNAFQQLSTLVPTDDRQRFSIRAPSFHIDGHDHLSVHARVAKALGRTPTQRGFAVPDVVFNVKEVEVRKRVFCELRSLGFVSPGPPGRPIGDDPGSFTFTTRGLSYFRGVQEAIAPLALHEPSAFVSRVDELTKAGVVDDARRAVLVEAYSCWKQGCHRAAMILTGLASEEIALSLVRGAVATYLPRASSSNIPWTTIEDDSQTFAARWAPTLQFLRDLKRWVGDPKKGGPGRGTRAWRRVEAHPDWLLPLGEAIRLARNEAAHSADRIPSTGDLTLLLSALPTQLVYIVELRDYLIQNPDGLRWPAL